MKTVTTASPEKAGIWTDWWVWLVPAMTREIRSAHLAPEAGGTTDSATTVGRQCLRRLKFGWPLSGIQAFFTVYFPEHNSNNFEWIEKYCCNRKFCVNVSIKVFSVFIQLRLDFLWKNKTESIEEVYLAFDRSRKNRYSPITTPEA